MINAGLSQNTIAKMNGVLARYPQVDQAILYGSRAKGSYKRGSDIDLTLQGGADLTLAVLYYIMDELDDLLLPYQIDLSIWHLIDDLALREHVERVGQPFYTRATDEISIPTL